MIPSRLVAATVPFSLAWEESPSPEGQMPSQEHFPSLKGFGGEPATALLALKLPGSSCPFNCAGSCPVPRASTHQERGRARSRIPGSSLFSANRTSPTFCFRPFRCQAPTQRASKSGVPRVKYNEQTRSSGLQSTETLKDIVVNSIHAPLLKACAS